MNQPIDDPYCGACGEMCCYKWVYEDETQGEGPWRMGGTSAYAVSDCCEADLFCDEALTIQWDPDPNEYGAFDPPEPII